MDDGVGSNPEASPRPSELHRLAEQVALATTLGVGFWDWDVRTGAVTRLNGTAAFLGEGYEEGPSTTRGWAQLIHPEDLILAHRAFEPCRGGQQDDWMSTLRLRRPDGSWQWMEIGGRVVERDPNGVPLRVLGVVQDNKARKLAEDAVLRDA